MKSIPALLTRMSIAEACLGLTDGVGSLLRIGDVERQREARVRVALRQSCHWLKRPCCGHDLISLFKDILRERVPESARCAGDEPCRSLHVTFL